MNSLQEKELQVLKEVIKVIEKNGLHYCAIGGTCLGAVRHNGFIPWDDDIDIALPRDEYELFRTKLYKELPEPFKKMDYDVSRSHNYVFFKIHDSSTTQIENYAKLSPDRITGAFVDIYPLDGVPSGRINRMLWFVKYRMLFSFNNLVRIDKIKVSGLKDVNRAILSSVLKKFCRYNYFTDTFRRFASKHSMKSLEFCHCNGYLPKEMLKHIWVKKFFEETILCDFECIKIRIPKDYDRFLTESYGDYMTLPPPDQRGKWHNVYISDMNTPCKYYADKIAEELKKDI